MAKPRERIGGRQKGTPNKASIATWDRIESEADPVGFLAKVMNGEAIKAAPTKETTETTEVVPTLDQRLTAASQLSRWMPPPPKVRPLRIDIPRMSKPEDMVAVMESVIAAMARGEITPDEAKTVAEVIEVQRRTIETESLETRIAALERTQP